jgi:hypothetical protein
MVVNPAIYYNILGLNFNYNHINPVSTKFVYFEGSERFLTLLGFFLIKCLWSYGVVIMLRFQGKNSPIIITYY